MLNNQRAEMQELNITVKHCFEEYTQEKYDRKNCDVPCNIEELKSRETIETPEGGRTVWGYHGEDKYNEKWLTM